MHDERWKTLTVHAVPQEKAQRTMLCTWLTEIFLERLSETSCASNIAAIDVDAFHAVSSAFEQFLVTNKVRGSLLPQLPSCSFEEQTQVYE